MNAVSRVCVANRQTTHIKLKCLSNNMVMKSKVEDSSLEDTRDLVHRYKCNPAISPLWHTRQESIAFNDIDPAIVKSWIAIFVCEMDALWRGIYRPEIYDSDTLWGSEHDSRKIARVINRFIVPTLRRGNARIDAPASRNLVRIDVFSLRYFATLERCGLNSHAGAWELCISFIIMDVVYSSLDSQQPKTNRERHA